MGELLAAVAVFVVSHMIPMRPRFRQPLERWLGLPGFLIGYSILSLAIIYWFGASYNYQVILNPLENCIELSIANNQLKF